MFYQKKLYLYICLMLCCNVSYAGAGKSGFNPDISLILDGRYGSYANTTDYALPGFMLGGEAGRGEQGFHLGHNELAMSANVDDLFYGKFTLAVADENNETVTELEEAYIETVGLGYGMTIRAGRFFSGIGYLNNKHGHSWDFVDAPLVYRALFGNQIIDDGLHLSWVAPVDIYLKIGAELTRGEKYPAGGGNDGGIGAETYFIKVGDDVNESHSWQLGLSHWQADVSGRQGGVHTHGGTTVTEIPTFYGNSQVNGIDVVWKWAPRGNSRDTNVKIQAEYFQRKEDGRVDMVGSSPFETTTYNGKQNGWYIQGAYQFMPRWRMGLRYDELDANNTGSDSGVLDEAGLSDNGHTPRRSTIMLDYSRSEFSRIRLQVAQDDSYADSDTLIFMQYVMSLGSHGAHAF